MSRLKTFALTSVALLMVFSLLFLLNGSLVYAEDNNFDELTTLNCKLEGTMEGEDAEFWYRIKNIGTEDEAFRLDATTLETEQTMGIIINQAEDSSFYKELGAGNWMPVALPMIRPFWERFREEHITAIGGADDWYRWAEADKDEFLIEAEVEGEMETIRVYDVKVDEPIEDSVFSP